jgi:hypothetical protein
MSRTHIATKASKITGVRLVGATMRHGGAEMISEALLSWLQGSREALSLTLNDGRVICLKPKQKLVRSDSSLQLEILQG